MVKRSSIEKKFIFNHLLRTHWKVLLLAFMAVIVEGLADLFSPWPIKIVLDNVVGSQHLPVWLSRLISGVFGNGKFAILNFAAVATVVVAAIGAIASYTESYLTTQVGQWVMRDLRQTLYHHIQKLSLTY